VGPDAAQRVRRITEGGDHHTWSVDEDLVARFASASPPALGLGGLGSPPAPARAGRRPAPAGRGDLTAAQLDLVQAVAPPLPAAPEREVLVHSDLKGEHLLIDQGRVAGVLDWTDAELGDPATDVAGLAIAVGAQAADLAAVATGRRSVDGQRAQRSGR
jgi:hypothetical protein